MYTGTMISDLFKVADQNLFVMREKFPPCDFVYSETIYGAGDAMECGRDSIGSSLEEMGPRCERHIRYES